MGVDHCWKELVSCATGFSGNSSVVLQLLWITGKENWCTALDQVINAVFHLPQKLEVWSFKCFSSRSQKILLSKLVTVSNTS